MCWYSTRTHVIWISARGLILHSPVLLQQLWDRKNRNLCSQGSSVWILHMVWRQIWCGKPSFLVQVSFISNRLYPPQWGSGWVFAVVHTTQKLGSSDRKVTEQGWKCSLSISEIENHRIFFPGKDRNNSLSYDPVVNMKQFSICLLSSYLPFFTHTLFFCSVKVEILQHRSYSATQPKSMIITIFPYYIVLLQGRKTASLSTNSLRRNLQWSPARPCPSVRQDSSPLAACSLHCRVWYHNSRPRPHQPLCSRQGFCSAWENSTEMCLFNAERTSHGVLVHHILLLPTYLALIFAYGLLDCVNLQRIINCFCNSWQRLGMKNTQELLR